MARVKKRKKLSGIIYFAVNTRIPNMVKIGKSIDSAEKRLESANKTNAFMVGRWSVTHKVKTNNVDRTESLAHELFNIHHDKDSISTEMFFVPEGYSIKRMADEVRSADVEYKKVEALEQERQRMLDEFNAKINGLKDGILNSTDLES